MDSLSMLSSMGVPYAFLSYSPFPGDVVPGVDYINPFYLPSAQNAVPPLHPFPCSCRKWISQLAPRSDKAPRPPIEQLNTPCECTKSLGDFRSCPVSTLKRAANSTTQYYGFCDSTQTYVSRIYRIFRGYISPI